VLERAGKLTPEADADGVALYRKQNGIGRIGVDLAAVLKNPRTRDNLVLQDGDSLIIPTYIGVVDVRGEVNSPVAVAYVPGADLSYYVAAAGGWGRLADSKRAFVTQPNGKVESRRRSFGMTKSPTPRAGAVVFVPGRDPNEKRDFVGAVTATAQVLASLVAIVVVLRR
jgi:protein involved in polysaccharide export with SLBB domain